MLGPDNQPPGIAQTGDQGLRPPEPTGLTPAQERLIHTSDGPTGYAAWIYNFDRVTNGLDYSSMRGEDTELARQGRRYAELLDIAGSSITQEEKNEIKRYTKDDLVSKSNVHFTDLYNSAINKIRAALQAHGCSEAELSDLKPLFRGLEGVDDYEYELFKAFGKGSRDDQDIREKVHSFALQVAGLDIAPFPHQEGLGTKSTLERVFNALDTVLRIGELPPKQVFIGRRTAGWKEPRGLEDVWDPLEDPEIPLQAVSIAFDVGYFTRQNELALAFIRENNIGEEVGQKIINMTSPILAGALPLEGSNLGKNYRELVNENLRKVLAREIPAVQVKAEHRRLQNTVSAATAHLEKRQASLAEELAELERRKAEITGMQTTIAAAQGELAIVEASLEALPGDQNPPEDVYAKVSEITARAKSL